MFFSSCKTPPVLQNPQASLEYKAIQAKDTSEAYLDFEFKAINPRSVAAELKISGWKTEINGAELKDGIVIFADNSADKTIFTLAPATDTQPAELETPIRLKLNLPVLINNGLVIEDDFKVNLELNLVYTYASVQQKKNRKAPNASSPIQIKVQETAVFPYIREPVFKITAIAVLKAELINTRFRVNMVIDNPNPFPVELSAFTYELYGDGRLWADGQEKNVFQIPPRQSRDTQLFLIMNFINMGRPLLDQVIALQKVAYRFKGNVLIKTNVDYLPRFTGSYDLSGYSQVLEK